MWPGLFSGQGAREEGRGPPTSEKARGKAPAVELPPPETDEEMAWWLQEEEDAVEQMRWGQDAATLAVVREATGPLMHRAKWRAWLGPPRWLGQASCPHGCGGPATGGGGNLATPPTLTTHPCPPFPFNTRGRPFAGCGHCCSLSHPWLPQQPPTSCWAMPGWRASQAAGGTQAMVARSWRGGW